MPRLRAYTSNHALAPALALCYRRERKHLGGPQQMKLFLAIAAILAWLFGAALLLAPAQFYAPTGIAMTPMIATIAEAHGATLIGLGVVDWLARGADRNGLAAVCMGNLVVQILSLYVVLHT